MASQEPAVADGAAPPGPNHARRLAVICIVLSLGSGALGYWVLGPRLPPGDQSLQGANQVWVNTVIAAIVLPIFLSIVAAFVYSFVVFRERAGSGEAKPIFGNRKAQRRWIAASAAITLFLWAFGTYEWIWPGVGSGGGQGPAPLVAPVGAPPLEVQVIGQQWEFTYRYPSYGGVETAHLVLPEGRYVEIHVTSLDVNHSFWAVGLGVKADAIPGFDNVTYVKPLQAGSFEIKCAELCGLWHGQMYDTGDVMAADRFAEWATRRQRDLANITKDLPAYAHTYDPAPHFR
jgi:cytochrome c oxidase subunit II